MEVRWQEFIIILLWNGYKQELPAVSMLYASKSVHVPNTGIRPIMYSL